MRIEKRRGRGIWVKARASGLRIAGSFPDLPSMELGFLVPSFRCVKLRAKYRVLVHGSNKTFG
jgi:hypothetical protein